MSKRRGVLASIIIVLIAGSLSLVSSYSYSSSEYQHMVVDNRDRSFLVRVPPSYSEDSDYPLVIGIHGAGNNAKIFEERSGFTEIVERENFIICYPNGNGRLEYSFLSWNAGYCCGYALDNDIDDVNFIIELINHLQNEYSIDSNRVYITGMSNGGILTHRLGAELSDTLAAIAPIASAIGGYATSGSDLMLPPSPTSALPVLMIHGTADTHVAYDGGEAFLSTGGRIDLSVNESVSFWVENNNCSRTPEVSVSENNLVETKKYTGGYASVLLYSIYNGLHIWPGEATENQKALEASEVIWSFFKNHSLSGT
ncbi:MAG: PHB depolymerase family esterase [Candidatus Thorarchaeota archaeon]